MLRSWDGLDLKVVLKESHKDKDKKQQKTHRFSLRTKRNNRETLPPPPPDILQTAHVCFLRQRKKKTKQTNKTYMCCGLKAPPHPPPRLTPPPPPCHPAGLVWQVLNVDSWHPGPLRRDAWIQTWHKHLSLCACAPLVGHSAPRAGSLGERWCGAGGGGDEPHNRNQWARRRPFCYSLSAHTPQCKWGREKRGRGRERGGRRRRECESERLSGEMFACVCVCVMQREREDVISWCLSKHKQSGLVVHMGPTTPSLLQSPQTKPKSSRAWGDAGGVFFKKKISSRRTEKQQQQKKRNTSSV